MEFSDPEYLTLVMMQGGIFLFFWKQARDLRAEMQRMCAESRAEFRSEMKEMRSEMKEMRSELHTENETPRAEMKEMRSEIGKELSNINDKLRDAFTRLGVLEGAVRGLQTSVTHLMGFMSRGDRQKASSGEEARRVGKSRKSA